MVHTSNNLQGPTPLTGHSEESASEKGTHCCLKMFADWGKKQHQRVGHCFYVASYLQLIDLENIAKTHCHQSLKSLSLNWYL